MFAQTFVADPEHDHFIGPAVPQGEAWALTTLWLRAGKGGLTEAMVGILDGETFVALGSRRNLMEGDAVTWSGDVLMTEGMAILYWTQGARQEEEIPCSATWKVLVGPKDTLAELRKEWRALWEEVQQAKGAPATAAGGEGVGAAASSGNGQSRPKGQRKRGKPDESRGTEDQ
jgi:hypothetical protein